MNIAKQRTAQLDRLGKLIGEMQTGMLATYDNTLKTLRSRPLTTLKMDDEPALWFLTSITSPKIAELDSTTEVCISYANGKDYVSISGLAQINRDRSVIDELWTPVAKIWFPLGKDDLDITALKVSIRSAEYWDGPGGSLTQLFALAAAATLGSDRPLGENVKITT